MPTDYSDTLFIIGKWHTKVYEKVIKKYEPTPAEKIVVEEAEDDEDVQQTKENYRRVRSEEARQRMRMRKPGRINRRGIADMRYEGTGWAYPFRK
jgi:Ni,Fe-hydrogenase III small subunit